MAAMTYADAMQFLQDWNVSDTSSRAIRNYTRIINDANFALHSLGKYDFDRKVGRLHMAAMIDTGTVSVGLNSVLLTGQGTNFTSWQMSGKSIRMAGESLSYIVASVQGALAATLELPYLPDSNDFATAVNFTLTQDRIALPALFRDFTNPTLTTLWWNLQPMTLEELVQARMVYISPSDPQRYSVEWVETSAGVKTPYIWLWPSPLNTRSFEFPYYAWAAQVSEDDDTLGFPVAANSAYYEFLKAFLLQEQKGVAAAMEQMAVAQRTGRGALKNFQPMDSQPQRAIWDPRGDVAQPVTNGFPGYLGIITP